MRGFVIMALRGDAQQFLYLQDKVGDKCQWGRIDPLVLGEYRDATDLADWVYENDKAARVVRIIEQRYGVCLYTRSREL